MYIASDQDNFPTIQEIDILIKHHQGHSKIPKISFYSYTKTLAGLLHVHHLMDGK